MKSTKKPDLIESKLFERLYLAGSMAILFMSTILWSAKSAGIQLSNADQLINSFLYESSATAKAALLPAQHSFLLKWPIFWVVRHFNYSSNAFSLTTIAVVLITVFSFGLILRRFEKRPLYLGTIVLALASALMLVPTQPLAGGLLPVNLAMIATRNLEYVLYMACLLGFAGVITVKSRRFWLSVAGFIILASTDKFFITLSLGGAGLALIVYAGQRRWTYVNFMTRWFIGGLIGSIGSLILLAILQSFNWVTFVGQDGTTPYRIILSLHNTIIAAIYSVLGILSNFGANPAYDALKLSDVPARTIQHIFSVSGPSFIVNILIVVGCAYALFGLIKASLRPRPNQSLPSDSAHKFVIAMAASSLASLGAFVMTDHYYAADARYLTIFLFCGFMAATVYLSRVKLPAKILTKVGLVFAVSTILAIPAMLKMNQQFKASGEVLVSRNKTVAQVLESHPVSTLLGDYWRVTPIRQQSKNQLAIMPLGSCSDMRQGLASKNWQVDLTKKSFAYLLTLEGTQTGFPNCSLEQVLQKYGRPNSSVAVDGPVSQPKETLLFYNHGTTLAANRAPSNAFLTSTVLPVGLNQLPATNCDTGYTTVSIVAHQDDDLLFMNPDISNQLKQGNCERTVYVTAGDAGTSTAFGWIKREQGIEAAYSNMLGIKNAAWTERVVKVSDNHYVKLANIRGNKQVSLVFMYLPDGNLKGDGFNNTSHQSLAKLLDGSIKSVNTVDQQSSYTSEDLVDVLTRILNIYEPTKMRSQSSASSSNYPDHSDHVATGEFASQAHARYRQQLLDDSINVNINFFMGYPVRDYPENISADELARKEAAFFEYAKHDFGVCGSVSQCAQTPTYNEYLKHQISSNY